MLWGTVMKIGILGNSVSMIMRPPRENRNDKTYAEILEKDDCYQIIHSGKRGAIINDAYGYLDTLQMWLLFISVLLRLLLVFGID